MSHLPHLILGKISIKLSHNFFVVSTVLTFALAAGVEDH